MYESVGLEAPFQLCSQGLGLDFALANSVQLHDNLGCTLNGQPVGLPRYYIKKLDIDTDIMREVGKSYRAKKVSEICRRLGVAFDPLNWELDLRPDLFGYFWSTSLRNYVKMSNEQKNETYKARKRAKKGVF